MAPRSWRPRPGPAAAARPRPPAAPAPPRAARARQPVQTEAIARLARAVIAPRTPPGPRRHGRRPPGARLPPPGRPRRPRRPDRPPAPRPAGGCAAGAARSPISAKAAACIVPGAESCAKAAPARHHAAARKRERGGAHGLSLVTPAGSVGVVSTALTITAAPALRFIRAPRALPLRHTYARAAHEDVTGPTPRAAALFAFRVHSVPPATMVPGMRQLVLLLLPALVGLAGASGWLAAAEERDETATGAVPARPVKAAETTQTCLSSGDLREAVAEKRVVEPVAAIRAARAPCRGPTSSGPISAAGTRRWSTC